MFKILEKIKNFFSGKYIYKPKCGTEKEGPKLQQEESQPQVDKTEQKPEEQK